MTIYSAEQIRAWDAFTIRHEPISSIDLMERAAQACVNWITTRIPEPRTFKIFCGKGNNGGDGLAIARLLFTKGKKAEVFILEFGKMGSDDFQTNLQRLHELPVSIQFIQTPEHFPPLDSGDIIIDALFGSGLNKPLEDLSAALVQYLNERENSILSIDLPSGLFADQSSKGSVVIKAAHTLTFQCYKLAFLMAENAPFTGDLYILNIGLHPGFIKETPSQKTLLDREFIARIFQPRNRFAHKGNFGHALLIGGSYGKIGAMQLAVKACLRSGAGLVTAYVPGCGYDILQTSAPEAMLMTDKDEDVLTELPPGSAKFTVLGIGPGMGTSSPTQEMLLKTLSQFQKPVVLDADALNCLSVNRQFLKKLPPNSILTPHPKEFDRLFGLSGNDFERMALAAKKAAELTVIIVLKGHHTLIALPDGKLYFNSTGNAGMAKGGSGDVLTGIITALCAQGYPPADAAILGVYLHGMAGDFAAVALSQEAMVSSDLIAFLSQAFKEVKDWKNNLIKG